MAPFTREMRTERGYLAGARGQVVGAGLLALGGSDGERRARVVRGFRLPSRRVARDRVDVAAEDLARRGDRGRPRARRWRLLTGSEYLDLVEVYRPGPPEAKPGSVSALGRWERCRPLSSGRSTLGLVGCLGTLYAVGGFTAPHYLSTCEAYDPNADQWWGLRRLGAPRAGTWAGRRLSTGTCSSRRVDTTGASTSARSRRWTRG